MAIKLPINARQLALCATLVVSTSSAQAFDFGSWFGGSDDKQAKTTQTSAKASVASKPSTGYATADALIGGISQQFGISQDQAIGGMGLLVGYAGSQLSPEYSAQLNSLLPGLAQNSSDSEDSLGGIGSMLSNSLASRDTVDAGFSALGMDPSLVDQFIPMLNGFVGDNASPELADAFSSALK